MLRLQEIRKKWKKANHDSPWQHNKCIHLKAFLLMYSCRAISRSLHVSACLGKVCEATKQLWSFSSFQTHRSDHLKSTSLVVDRFLKQTVTLFFTCNSSIVELWFSREVLLTGGSFASQGRHFNVLDLLSICSRCISLCLHHHLTRIKHSTFDLLLWTFMDIKNITDIEVNQVVCWCFLDQCVAFQQWAKSKESSADHQAWLATALSKTILNWSCRRGVESRQKGQKGIRIFNVMGLISEMLWKTMWTSLSQLHSLRFLSLRKGWIDQSQQRYLSNNQFSNISAAAWVRKQMICLAALPPPPPNPIYIIIYFSLKTRSQTKLAKKNEVQSGDIFGGPPNPSPWQMHWPWQSIYCMSLHRPIPIATGAVAFL